MEVSASSSVICCNGGNPFVNLVHISPKSSHFVSEFGPGADTCQRFRVEFNDDKTYVNYKKMNGTLACQCEKDFYGSQCQLKRDAFNGSGNGSSFKMSLFLAVVPLSFAVFAAIGGFMCKMFPCCFCFDFQWPKNCLCWNKKMSSDNSAEFDENYDYDENQRHNIHVDVHSVDLQPVNDWNHPNDNYQNERTMLPFGVDTEATVSALPIINQHSINIPLLPEDPPPPFSHTEVPHCCNCRKYSPPPPYSEVAQSVDPSRQFL